MALEKQMIRELQCVPGMTITGVQGPYKTLANITAILSDGSERLLLRSLDKADALLVQRQLEKWLKIEKGVGNFVEKGS